MRLRQILRWGAGLFAASLLVFFLIPPRLMQDVPFSRAVLDRNGQLLRLTLADDQTYRLYTPLSAISPRVIDAVLLHEDRHFYQHPGVNPISALRAGLHYLGMGGRGGASTLTMQLARLRWGLHTRSLAGKLWQMAQAVRIELHYSKNEILEAYLNLAPYGGNIVGVGAASHVYFGRGPDDASLPEALTLALVPQSPLKRSPGKNTATDKTLLQARLRLFSDWTQIHPQDARFQSLLHQPMHYGSRRDLPFIAPQFSARMLREQKGNRIVTTLDRNLQTQMTGLIHRYVTQRSELGIVNAAALLVDTRDRSVVASIGSEDYFNRARGGMMDGTLARRSPGSALKPFIYALAFDQGVIHPLSLMRDAPMTFSTYTPENFDHAWQGPLSAHDALIKSRNIPALWLAEQLKRPDFYHFLQSAGIGHLRPMPSYGLSLVLGGAEVTMEELASLYTMLADDGNLAPLRRTMDAPSPAPVRLISPEAAFMTLDILRDTPPPGGSATADTLPMPVYWKTGTSGGLRDAWSAGVFGPYVLVVWAGDFRGSVSGHYVGIVTAAPLFFELMRTVVAQTHPADTLESKTRHLHLVRRLACSDTGDVDVDFCPAREPVWLIPGISPIKQTGIYRRVLVDDASGELACHFEPGKTSYRVLQFWPSDLTRIYAEAGIVKTPPPPVQAACSGHHAGAAPKILSPAKDVHYKMLESGDNRLPLTASLDGATHRVFWFEGNIPLGSAGPDEPFYLTLKRGHFVIRAVDDTGAADSRLLIVE